MGPRFFRVGVLDRRGFAIVVHCLWAILLAGLAHEAMKWTVGRHRPMVFMPSPATVANARPDYEKP